MNFYVVVRDYVFPLFAVISYYTCCILLYGLTTRSYKKLNLHECNMSMFAVILNMPIPFGRFTPIMRFFYTLASVCCYVANTTIVAYYTMFAITAAKWKQVENVREIIQNGFQLSGIESSLAFLNEQKMVRSGTKNSRLLIKCFFQFPDEFLKNYQICHEIGDCLNQLKWNDRLAVGVSSHLARNYPPVPYTEMKCFGDTESIRGRFIAMYVWKGHPLLAEILSLTNRAFESGLFVKWHREVQHSPKEMYKFPVVQFEVEHLGAALVCFSIFLFAAFVAFATELVIHKKLRAPNPHRFWILIDVIINDNRYFLNAYE